MLKLLLLSDLHFEFHKDSGRSFVKSLPKEGVDVCILAGDITSGLQMLKTLEMFCNRYPHVIYVHGNHEFYSHSREEIYGWTQIAGGRHSNLHWLDNSSVEIGGQRFIGAPMWFKEDPLGHFYKRGMADFAYIPNFTKWVYKENAKTLEYLKENVTADDVVVTHHLPSLRSISPRFTNSPLNAFFVCPAAEEVIRTKQPKLWVHGHTHDSRDYTIEKTRVVCNPFGYARNEENPEFDFEKIVML